MDVLDGVIGTAFGLRVFAGQADGKQYPPRDGRLRAFGVLSSRHAEPVVPGPSACTFGRAGAFERRDVVRHVADPDGQPDPRDAGSGDAGQALSALRFAAGTPGEGWWAASLPAPGRPPSGRARRHRILLAKISCSNCSRRKRGDGAVEYHHNMVTAARVAPGHARAIPLAPEFVVPQEGRRSRTARAGRRGAGWPPTGPAWRG